MNAAAAEHTPGKYKVELIIAWTVVSIPLGYGVFNALRTAAQLITG